MGQCFSQIGRLAEQNKDQIDAAVKQGQAMADVRNNTRTHARTTTDTADTGTHATSSHLAPVRIGAHTDFVRVFSCWYFVQSIDKEAIEMGVKEKLIAVADAAKALAAEYTKRIEGGETIDVSADSILPVVATPAEGEEKKAEPTMKLEAASTPEQRLQTAVYVAGNQKTRDDISARTCAEIKAELENNDKVPPAAKAKVEEQLPGLLVKALEAQIKAMAGKALKGEPLMSEEDIAKLAAYKEKKVTQHQTHNERPETNEATPGGRRQKGRERESKRKAQQSAVQEGAEH